MVGVRKIVLKQQLKGKNAANWLRFFPVVALFALIPVAWGQEFDSHVDSRTELEYGPVLYEFYQRRYFDALVENRFALANDNRIANSPSAQILHGGMLVSYAMPDHARQLFLALLDEHSNVDVRNRAWFHLARLYYRRSDYDSARRALDRVQGQIADDLLIEYHYLASLVNNDRKHVDAVNAAMSELSGRLPHYSYLLFNMAVTQLRRGQVLEAVNNLEEIAVYAGDNRELSALSDRAKHGLAQLATQAQDLPRAWHYLTGIHTTGLYSNRALLSYAWTAIKMELFTEAIPALQLLDQRSIAIPEVQEAKVLLAHLYEQEGSPRKALKSNLMAEKAFKYGLNTLAEARKIIARQDVPREFIKNLEVIMDESDWYGTSASVDYKKLTPFLIDLMASHPFNETLKDLAALYTLEENLSYWLIQIEEHQLVLDNAREKDVSADLQALVKRSENISDQLEDQKAEIKLATLTLEQEDKDRFQVLIDKTEHDLRVLRDKIKQLKKDKKPYVQPANYAALVKDNHQRIKRQLALTRQAIGRLEPVMRNLVKSELDKHEERMRYYWAQSRLAKARLFDATLLELENVNSPAETPPAGEEKK